MLQLVAMRVVMAELQEEGRLGLSAGTKGHRGCSSGRNHLPMRGSDRCWAYRWFDHNRVIGAPLDELKGGLGAPN
jgi:hypothetical protein